MTAPMPLPKLLAALDRLVTSHEALALLTSQIAAHRREERERCAAFAYTKHDWPPRWIASSLRMENDGYRGWLADRALPTTEPEHNG